MSIVLDNCIKSIDLQFCLDSNSEPHDNKLWVLLSIGNQIRAISDMNFCIFFFFFQRGKIRCRKKKCPVLKCKRQYRPTGHCCPVCKSKFWQKKTDGQFPFQSPLPREIS